MQERPRHQGDPGEGAGPVREGEGMLSAPSRPEDGGPPTSTEEREKAPVIRREVEFKDAEGRTLGRAEIELEDREVDVEYPSVSGGGPAKGRPLRSFVIVGERDGEQVRVDVLGLANPHGVEVVVADEYLENYSYTDRKKRALSPPLNTPLDVGVLLHELGHADQFHERRFEKLVPLYASERSKEKLTPAGVKRVVDGVMDAIPNLAAYVDREALAQFGRLQERMDELAHERDAISEKMNRQDERESETVGEMLRAAMAERLDLDRFLERCVEVDEDIADHAGDEAYAAERVRELRQTLKAVGFRFARADEASGPVRFDSGLAGLPSVREDDIDEVSKISDLAQSVAAGRPVVGAEVRYSRKDGVLTVDMIPPSGVGSGPQRVTLELDMPPAEYDRISAGFAAVAAEFAALKRKADGLEVHMGLIDETKDDLVRGTGLSEIIAVPTKVMERDATRRAIQWMRRIRDSAGVNLMLPHRVRPESMVAVGVRPGDCVDDTARGMDAGEVAEPISTVYEDLKRALRSYGAGKEWKLRKPGVDEDGPDTIRPMPPK